MSPWLAKPLSDRAIEDARLLKLIKESFVASGCTYGSPWIHCSGQVKLATVLEELQ